MSYHGMYIPSQLTSFLSLSDCTIYIGYVLDLPPPIYSHVLGFLGSSQRINLLINLLNTKVTSMVKSVR